MSLLGVASGCSEYGYERPKSPPDVRSCKTAQTVEQVGTWTAVLGGMTVIGSGIAYATSSAPTANVNLTPSTSGTTYPTSVSECAGGNVLGGATCDRTRDTAVAVGAVALGATLLGLVMMEGADHSFDAHGCGSLEPARPQRP